MLGTLESTLAEACLRAPDYNRILYNPERSLNTTDQSHIEQRADGDSIRGPEQDHQKVDRENLAIQRLGAF